MKEIIDIFLMNPIGQTFWILWMITVVTAFLQKDDKRVIEILAIAHIFWAGHFYFMEIYSWLWMVIIGFIRLLISMKYKKNNKMFLIVLWITLWLWAITYQDIHSLFPLLASCLWTFGYFYLEKIKLRLLLLFVSWFWLSFHYVNFSIGWVINESIIQIIHLITIYRIMVETWWTRAYIRDIKEKIFHKPRIDHDRYIAIIDFIKMKNKK